MNREQLIKTYGSTIVSKACDYFELINRHFTVEELENKCKEYFNERNTD